MKKTVSFLTAIALALTLTACAQSAKPDSKDEAGAKTDGGSSQEMTAEPTTEEVVDAHFQIIVRAYDGKGNLHGEETGTIDGNVMTIEFTENDTDYVVTRKYNPNGFSFLPENPIYTGEGLERGDLEGVIQKCFGHVISKKYKKADGTSGERAYTFDGNKMNETFYDDGVMDYTADYEFEEHGIEIKYVQQNAGEDPGNPSNRKCEYDASGNPVKLFGQNSNDEWFLKESYEYDSSNRVVKRIEYISEDKIDGYEEFEYNNDGNLTKIFKRLGSTDECWEYFELEYDDDGNLSSYTEYDDDKKGTVKRVYTYEYVR